MEAKLEECISRYITSLEKQDHMPTSCVAYTQQCEDGEREREGGSSGVGRARLNRETLLEYSGAFRQKERAL